MNPIPDSQKEIKDHLGKSYGIYCRFSTDTSTNTRASEIGSATVTQTSLVQYKNFLTTELPSPCYLLKSKKRE